MPKIGAINELLSCNLKTEQKERIVQITTTNGHLFNL